MNELKDSRDILNEQLFGLMREQIERVRKEIKFHLALAEECASVGTDFGNGRACGIRELISDIERHIGASQ